ncbi:Centromere protein J [Ooceraea biroi]|uniref:Centromere protein J n=1 Tax=Ooceraea biroi TaxID=2015173 RepID=A0A026VTK5_OOCBI|nr:Centromere protein J [Ooceraea biroi]
MDLDMNVQVEASIVERLQKLRQWQLEQQEKLMKQQQIQREILSHEQDLVYKALSLSVHDISNIVENTENIPVIHWTDAKEMMPEALTFKKGTKTLDSTDRMTEEEISVNDSDAVCKTYEEEIEESIHVAAAADKSGNSMKNYCSSVLSQKEELSDDLLIEGVKPLSRDDKTSNEHVSFDDIPLPSPRKDFKTLLEEKLKREPVIQKNARADTKTQTKRPFLKKGKGLSRFKISTNSRLPATTTKKCTLSSDAQRTDKSGKSKKSAQKDSSSSSVPTASKTRQLNLKTVPLPRSKTAVKSGPVAPAERKACSTASNRPEHLPEMNVSDLDSKAERELEEMRIFELLEEKAENSSFCSTSSTVLAFLQQSTPFKVKKKELNRAAFEGNIVASVKQQSDKRGAGDTIERQPISTQRPAHVENARPSARFEQSGAHKRSRTSVATSVESYWDTVVDDTRGEAQRRPVMVDQASQSKQTHGNYLEDRGTSRDADTVALSSSDEENDVPMENNRNLARDGESEMSHRVRFAEYNEYRTIDLTDTSDTLSKSPLRDCLEEDWHDRSGNTSDSSDVEERQENYEGRASPLRMIGDDERIVSSSGRLFSQENAVKDSYYRVMKASSIPEEDNDLNYKDESACENNEEDTDQMSDEEMQKKKEETEEEEEERQSVLSSLSSSSLSDVQSRKYMLRNQPYELTKKVAKVSLNARDAECCPSEDRTSQTSTFEPELLKSRLLELEQEIDIFRKESSALLFQRRKLQEEQATLRKEYAEKERTFEENKKRVQNQLEEEKKRLTREKAAMENRIRDAQEKARQNKMERQKAQNLQEELEQLRDELSTKESRWNAAESRYKSELRALRVGNSKLKQEIANLQNVRKTNMKNIRRRSTVHGQVITRGISQINKRLTAISAKETAVKTSRDSPDVCARDDVRRDEDEEEDENENESESENENENENKDKDEDETRSAEPITQAIDVNSDFEQVVHKISANKMESRQAGSGSQANGNEKSARKDIARKKRHLYEILLKDATSDFAESQGGPYVTQDASDLRQPLATQAENSSPRSNRASEKISDRSSVTNNDLCVGKNTEHCADRSREVNRNPDEDGTRPQGQESSEEKRHSSSASYLSSHRLQAAGINTKETVQQIQFADGRIEYWYPNGNVKKIFPEQGITKMIYYNGDVRETDKAGRVKYFYATTRTWHITTPDGVEILEFSNGQVEKRTSDGTVEVTFPDGSVQVVQADGTDKVSLPDGTVVQTFANGDKILTLPNGQREVHTKDHKRREYPDGTMKTIYVDGTQETRYSNGRRRLKDKDGNLLMDTYEDGFLFH